jgi:hypothetical protein
MSTKCPQTTHRDPVLYDGGSGSAVSGILGASQIFEQDIHLEAGFGSERPWLGVSFSLDASR